MSDSPQPHPRMVRGMTGFAELTETELLYRQKADHPALKRVPLDAIERILVSKSGDTFDVLPIGAKARKTPSLFSETSISRGNRTTSRDWSEFVEALIAAVDAARARSPRGE